MKRSSVLTVAASLAAGLVVSFAAVAADDLIPRKIIFGNPEKNQPLVSPDGSKIAFSAPVSGVMNVWVGPANDIAAAKPVTQEKVRPIRIYGPFARKPTIDD